MVNWQVTATTVHCEDINDEVTIMVYHDGSTKCTGYQKHKKTTQKQDRNKVKCEGPECPQAIRYRDKLFAEEEAKSRGVGGS